jgi:hypothetical protein
MRDEVARLDRSLGFGIETRLFVLIEVKNGTGIWFSNR